MAAGLTIDRDRVDDFSRCFNDSVRGVLSHDDLVPDLRIDMEVTLAELTPSFESLLRHLEPCGMGNPSPMLVTRGVRLAEKPRIVGKGGLKLRLDNGSDTPLEALGWTMGHRIAELDISRPIDIAYRLERDEYQGKSRLQLRLADFRHSERSAS